MIVHDQDDGLGAFRGIMSAVVLFLVMVLAFVIVSSLVSLI